MLGRKRDMRFECVVCGVCLTGLSGLTMGICSAVFQSMPGAAAWQQWAIHHDPQTLTDEVSLARRQLLLTFSRAL